MKFLARQIVSLTALYIADNKLFIPGVKIFMDPRSDASCQANKSQHLLQQKCNEERVEDYNQKIDTCRRNMKLISGVLNFAKRLRNESEESLRENAVRELKQR